MIQKVMIFNSEKDTTNVYFSKGKIVKIHAKIIFWQQWEENMVYYIHHNKVFTSTESDPDYSLYEAVPNLIEEAKDDYKKFDSIKRNN